MRTRSVLAAGLLTLTFTPLAAQMDMDYEAMARWGNARVVRYQIVGVYQAQTVIAHGEEGGQADVTDRVTIELDWDMHQQAIVGQPKIQNSKSEVNNLRNEETSCPAPVPHGDYEHIEVTQVRASGDQLAVLSGTTSYPHIEVTAYCQGQWVKKTVDPHQETREVQLPILPPVTLAMPAGTNAVGTVSADKKSFTMAADGWTWTYTPTLVS